MAMPTCAFCGTPRDYSQECPICATRTPRIRYARRLREHAEALQYGAQVDSTDARYAKSMRRRRPTLPRERLGIEVRTPAFNTTVDLRVKARDRNMFGRTAGNRSDRGVVPNTREVRSQIASQRAEVRVAAKAAPTGVVYIPKGHEHYNCPTCGSSVCYAGTRDGQPLVMRFAMAATA